MIGYTKHNNEYYRGDYITHKIKSAVSRSGGNYLHYELFKSLLESSIFNTTLDLAHQDCRAGYSLLFIYPIKVRILLSIILHRTELDSSSEYTEYTFEKKLVNPVTNLELINKLSQVRTSKSVKQSLINLPSDFDLYSPNLQDLLSKINITTEFDFREDSLKSKLEKSFLLLNNSYPINSEFIDITTTNNRVRAAQYICRHLNYKPVSINIINQAIEQWTIKNLSI